MHFYFIPLLLFNFFMLRQLRSKRLILYVHTYILSISSRCSPQAAPKASNHLASLYEVPIEDLKYTVRNLINMIFKLFSGYSTLLSSVLKVAGCIDGKWASFIMAQKEVVGKSPPQIFEYRSHPS
jgi:hypothetical protein